ncbi:outer membrane protein [Marinobacter sp. M1N3S26]|uniref:outer membrane protein n=1 Tax=Marinobacter sp. M1N3S26 TaxID=3382299 RepID=UPI00387B21C5
MRTCPATTLPARLASAAVLAMGVPLSTTFASESSDDYHYEFTPYFWAAGLEGDMRIQDRPTEGAEVEQSFSDIWRNLEAAFMGSFEVRRGNWGLMLDAIYFQVEESGNILEVKGVARVGGKAEVTQEQYAAAVTYRFTESPQTLDVVGGLRYNAVSWDVSIDGDASLPIGGQIDRDFDHGEDWFLPYLGARIIAPVHPRWTLTGYADMGGFDPGSNMSWQLLIGANYAINDRFIAKLGYRHIDNDYKDSDFEYDMTNAGPYLGIGIHW